MGVTPPPGAEPSVKVPGNILRVTISENDGIRGIVQFNVTTVEFSNKILVFKTDFVPISLQKVLVICLF